MTVTLLEQTLELSFFTMYTEQWLKASGLVNRRLFHDSIGTMTMSVSITTISINPTALFIQNNDGFLYRSESLIMGQ